MKCRLLFLGLSALIISCGPSAEQKAAMQIAHDDSVKAVTALQVRKQMAIAKARQDSAQAAQALLVKLKNDLIDIRAKLDGANDQMTRIKGFVLGRTPAQRESQIEAQSKYIQQLNDLATQLQNKINTMQ